MVRGCGRQPAQRAIAQSRPPCATARPVGVRSGVLLVAPGISWLAGAGVRVGIGEPLPAPGWHGCLRGALSRRGDIGRTYGRATSAAITRWSA